MTAERLRKRLIVVADSSLIVEAIAIALSKSGDFSLVGRVNARTEPVRAIVDAEPDVVLVDDQEQSMKAVELVKQVKGQRPPVVAIMLTMSMDPDWLDAVFAAGAAGAISKATHPAALPALVRETVNRQFFHVHKRASGAPLAAATAATIDPPLTTRELAVLQLLASGLGNAEIARKLWITKQTVKFHLSHVYRKLGVANRTEASHFAHVNGMVEAVQETRC